MLKNTFLTGLILCLSAGLSAQSLSSKVVASGGGFKTSAAGSLTYTIGETFVTTLKTTNNALTQGFQQGGAGNGSSVVDLTAENISVQLYPNPASSYVEFSITTPANTKVGIAIYNVLGDKICDVSEVSNNGFNFHAVHSTSGLAAGVYFAFVSITDNAGNTQQTISKSFIVNN